MIGDARGSGRGNARNVHWHMECGKVDAVAVYLADVELFFDFADVDGWDAICSAPDTRRGFGMLFRRIVIVRKYALFEIKTCS